MGKLFGTDGIRGICNRDHITPELGFKLGRAIVHFYKRRGNSPFVVIGRDTRASGEMLEHALLSGIISEGWNVFLAGVLPTPGVAYLTRKSGAGSGIAISASHNPHEYNGFKIFSHEGYKLSDSAESEIEDLIFSPDNTQLQEGYVEPGTVEVLDNAVEQYISFLLETITKETPFKGMKIVIDCANGATYHSAPSLFDRLGAETECLFTHPDGKNINQNCGSEHTEALRHKVLKTASNVGLAFDGDGDRLIAVDENGRTLTGDQILTICAKMLKGKNELKKDIVVSTVMSNIGFQFALNDLGIKHISAKVGDRHVMEEMKAQNAVLGGEVSGHIIFSDYHTTGDGLLSALQLLSAMKKYKSPLSKLSELMTFFPQTLINVPVQTKPDISTVPELVKVIEKIQQKLGKKGRVLVRYSGTEPVCRVMVEGEKEYQVEEYGRKIAMAVRENLSYSNSSDSSVG